MARRPPQGMAKQVQVLRWPATVSEPPHARPQARSTAWNRLCVSTFAERGWRFPGVPMARLASAPVLWPGFWFSS